MTEPNSLTNSVSNMDSEKTTCAEADSVDFDIVIAGGGLSGCLMAKSLTSLTQSDGQSLRIAIVEPTTIKSDNHSTSHYQEQTFDDRVIALSHASSDYLNSLNVWSNLKEYTTAIKHIHVSDRGHYGKARIHANEHNVEALGYVVELSRIAASLIHAVEKNSNITWYCPDRIDVITWSKSQVNVTLTSQKSLTAKLLIACDGAQSKCRRAANIQTTVNDYHQSAVIANVVMSKPHQNIAYERFTEFGPIAMLPMQGKQCSLVWTHNNEQANALASLDDSAFKSALFNAFGGWLGEVEQVSRRSVFPLKLVQAQAQTYHRMALIGNASHTIHPIAGQGFNLGLRDVECLAGLIKSRLANDNDLGHFTLLNEYQRLRAQDQQQVIGLTDAMVTLFSNQHMPLVVGRNLGIKAMNYLTPLQNLFVNKTMGY